MCRLDAYHADDYAEVLEMLQDHINYAPEYGGLEAEENDRKYFEENFSNGSAGGNAYILMSDDKHIISFMTCEKVPTECDRFRWYVTNLFVRKNMESNKTAKRAIDLFSEEIYENESLSINVNSEFKEIISFWQESGFKISPDRSVFQNADNEILIALTKGITGLSS